MSSIARAFTLRRKRTDSAVSMANSDVPNLPSPPRAASMRFSKKTIDPKDISGPVQLLSTTNMLTYNAPDVAVVQAQRKASSSVSSVSSSRTSTDESDASSTASTSRDAQLTDDSSVGSISPVASPNSEKKMTFESAPAVPIVSNLRRSVSTVEIRSQTLVEEHESELPRSESPAIPQRHPSHSKKAHSDLAKKRSMQVIPTSSMTRAHSIASTSSLHKEVNRASIDFFNGAKVDDSHPFVKELEQLDEVVEEFGGSLNADAAADLQAMRQHGLVRFCAADYLAEIEPLFSTFTGGSHLSVPALGWI